VAVLLAFVARLGLGDSWDSNNWARKEGQVSVKNKGFLHRKHWEYGWPGKSDLPNGK
jgi:hypothetical protein